MGFPTSHQTMSCVTPNFPKIGFRYPNLSFFCKNFDKKSLKICYKVSLSKNSQRQRCSAFNYLSNGVDILAADDSVPVTFGPKGTDPNRKDALFTFYTRRAVQSALADLRVTLCSSETSTLSSDSLVKTSPYITF